MAKTLQELFDLLETHDKWERGQGASVIATAAQAIMEKAIEENVRRIAILEHDVLGNGKPGLKSEVQDLKRTIQFIGYIIVPVANVVGAVLATVLGSIIVYFALRSFAK